MDLLKIFKKYQFVILFVVLLYFLTCSSENLSASPNRKYTNIIKTILVKADGNPINNIQDYVFASYGKLFESYKNSNLKNILYYSFSEFPDKYQPSGHLNYELIQNLNIELKIKKNLYDKLYYKFDTYVYLMVYKIINIEKDSLSLTL